MTKNVVVIEDDEDILKTMKFFMTKNSWNFFGFSSVKEYFDQNELPINLIYLVDWTLPGLHGVEFVRILRSRNNLSPILMLSAYNSENHVKEALSAGANDYIVKPCSYEDLLTKLNSVYMASGTKV